MMIDLLTEEVHLISGGTDPVTVTCACPASPAKKYIKACAVSASTGVAIATSVFSSSTQGAYQEIEEQGQKTLSLLVVILGGAFIGCSVGVLAELVP